MMIHAPKFIKSTQRVSFANFVCVTLLSVSYILAFLYTPLPFPILSGMLRYIAIKHMEQTPSLYTKYDNNTEPARFRRPSSRLYITDCRYTHYVHLLTFLFTKIYVLPPLRMWVSGTWTKTRLRRINKNNSSLIELFAETKSYTDTNPPIVCQTFFIYIVNNGS
jgi:hypothetical protein